MPDGWEVGAEQCLAPAWALDEVADDLRPVAGRIGARAQVDVGKLEGHGDGFLHPRPTLMGEDELRLGEVQRGPVDADGLAALARVEAARRPRLHGERHAELTAQ